MNFFLIAGEPSGDHLGASLMAGLRELVPDATFLGVGGPQMTAQGLTSLFPMEELSLMGIWEVAPKYRHLMRRIEQTAQAVIDAKPDVLITIDSPDFCLRVAKRVRARLPLLRTVHYVAPSVWAWRPGRARKMAKVIDHVLAILPFEPPYMREAGMTCDFVGHPMATAPIADAIEAAQFRADHGVAPTAPMVLCLPGSRRSEIARLGLRFGAALALAHQRLPELRVALPTLPHLTAMIDDLVRDWPVKPIVVTDPDQKRAAFAAADAALAASGTVSLDLAASAVPMVIGYDMAPLSRWLLGLLLKTDTVTLVNLVSETRTVPEFLGRECRPEPMASALSDLLSNPAAREAQMAAMALTMERLGRGGEAPGLRAARSVLGAIKAAR